MEDRGHIGESGGPSPVQVKTVLRLAAARPRLPDRSTVVLMMSIGLGLRAKELAALRWVDLFDTNWTLRDVLHLKAAYTRAPGRGTSIFRGQNYDRPWMPTEPNPGRLNSTVPCSRAKRAAT